jgi:hypothetical protein
VTPEEKPVEGEAPPCPEEEKPGVEWKYKTEFAIHGKMREVIHLAISATESELATLRRKLAKAQYGG